jgi:hypothetical protein
MIVTTRVQGFFPCTRTCDRDTGHCPVDTGQSLGHKFVELVSEADLDASPSSHTPLPHSARSNRNAAHTARTMRLTRVAPKR